LRRVAASTILPLPLWRMMRYGDRAEIRRIGEKPGCPWKPEKSNR
jgi:hypothetical protein